MPNGEDGDENDAKLRQLERDWARAERLGVDLSRSRPQHERGEFIYEYPNLSSEDGHMRLVFVTRGFPSAYGITRGTATIQLLYPRGLPIHRPFFYRLVPAGSAGSSLDDPSGRVRYTPSDPPDDTARSAPETRPYTPARRELATTSTLFLFVDRDVQVNFPGHDVHAQPQQPRNQIRKTRPPGAFGRSTKISVRVPQTHLTARLLVHVIRSQRLDAVPQFPGDYSRMFPPARVTYGPETHFDHTSQWRLIPGGMANFDVDRLYSSGSMLFQPPRGDRPEAKRVGVAEHPDDPSAPTSYHILQGSDSEVRGFCVETRLPDGGVELQTGVEVVQRDLYFAAGIPFGEALRLHVLRAPWWFWRSSEGLAALGLAFVHTRAPRRVVGPTMRLTYNDGANRNGQYRIDFATTSLRRDEDYWRTPVLTSAERAWATSDDWSEPAIIDQRDRQPEYVLPGPTSYRPQPAQAEQLQVMVTFNKRGVRARLDARGLVDVEQRYLGSRDPLRSLAVGAYPPTGPLGEDPPESWRETRWRAARAALELTEPFARLTWSAKSSVRRQDVSTSHSQHRIGVQPSRIGRNEQHVHPQADVKDDRVEVAFDVTSTVLGFIPVVGDVFDLVHLAYALFTGEDFVGREVSGLDLALMTVALLPAIPAGIRGVGEVRRSVRAAEDAIAADQQLARRLEEIQQQLDAHPRGRRGGAEYLARAVFEVPAEGAVDTLALAIRQAVARGADADPLLMAWLESRPALAAAMSRDAADPGLRVGRP